MESNKEEHISPEATHQETPIDLNKLNLESLVDKLDELSKEKNPYSVSKNIENIKSSFYKKLKIEVTDKQVGSYNEKEIVEKKVLHPIEIKFKESLKKYQKKKSVFRKEREITEERNLIIKKQIIKDIEKLTKEDELIKETFTKFRELQNKWKNTGYIPITHNNNLWQSYHHHVELFYDFIKLNNDLRDLDLKKNLEQKIIICEKAEKLENEKSLNKMHEFLQELHEHWKDIGPVKKEFREEIWERFQTISKKLNKKRNDHFLEKKKEYKNRFSQKNNICEEIDALTKEHIPNSYNKWQSLTTKCNELEVKWRSLGKLNKDYNKAAWKNLRTSLNEFYKRKNIFYKERKNETTKALEKRNIICEKAEEIQNNKSWKTTTDQLIVLQKEWHTTDRHYKKEQSNKLWKRFKKACDTFFKAKKEHIKTLKNEKKNNLKKKKEIVKKLENFVCSANKNSDLEDLKKISDEFRSIGTIDKEKLKINNTFLLLLNTKYETIGLSRKEVEKEKYKNKVSLLTNDKERNNEKEVLRKKIDSIKKDIAQYENNMSFLGKNKKTKPLIDKVLEEINNSNNEIEIIKEKIKILKEDK